MISRDHTSARLQKAASPHIRARRTTRNVMMDVLIALTPSVIWSVLLYGFRVLPHYMLTIGTAVMADTLIRTVRKSRARFDFSPIVTGMLLTMSLPVTAPLWFGPFGAAIGILLAKELFGGIGRNFLNPALAGRAVLRLLFETQMTQNPAPTPLIGLPIWMPMAEGIDAMSHATPLWVLKDGALLSGDGLLASFLGLTAGKLGETSALLLLLIGAAYLVIRGVIRLRVPVAMLGSMAVMAWLFGSPAGFMQADWRTVAGHVIGGASILGAFYMATDYGSSPSAPLAQVLFGVGLGVITMLFRFFSGYSEGFTFAALIMNLTVPLMNRYIRPRVLGEAGRIG